MRLLEVVIKPLSAFGTPLKGDTLFGHLCWQISYDESLISGDFSEWIERYQEQPFAVVSSAYPVVEREGKRLWLFKRPSLPLHYFGEEEGECTERLRKLKEKKKKAWIEAESLEINPAKQRLLSPAEAEKEYGVKIIHSERHHNSINRLSFTTGENFAPFVTESFWFSEETNLSVFVAYEEKALTAGSIEIIFQRMGIMGFGKDSTWGMGRFDVLEVIEHTPPQKSRYLYALSPFVPRKNSYERIWFQPFVRFGRHGSYLAVGSNPFKEPILMADEAAVIKCKEPSGFVVGRGIKGISKAEPNTVAQGYTITLPLRMEESS